MPIQLPEDSLLISLCECWGRLHARFHTCVFIVGNEFVNLRHRDADDTRKMNDAVPTGLRSNHWALYTGSEVRSYPDLSERSAGEVKKGLYHVDLKPVVPHK